MRRVALTLMTAAVLSGCASMGRAPEAAPLLELPQGTATVPEVAGDWWTAFGDVRLNTLVDEALANNRDLARAMARIDESRAALRLARAAQQPQVSLAGASARQRASETSVGGLGGGVGTDHRAVLNLSYEADLWGRAARASAAARDELLATTLARETVRSALAAQVVQGYAALQALDAQRSLFGRAVEGQREALKLQRLRHDAGVIGELDLQQLQAELLANEARLPQLDRAQGEAERALSLLLGRSPRAVADQGVGRAEQALVGVAQVPGGLPSDLLQRRPDIVAAEARLRAAGARVDAARAAYLPSLSLTAAFGGQSAELSRLMDGPSLVWGVVASLTQPLWDGGRIGAGVDAAQARRLQIELDYRDTVAVAFKEVRDALAAEDETRRSLALGRERAQALSRASELTRLRHEAGEASRLLVIEAERAALAAQAQNAETQRAWVGAQADLWRALGGGWRNEGSTAARAR